MPAKCKKTVKPVCIRHLCFVYSHGDRERTHPITSWCSRCFGCITCLGTLFLFIGQELQLSDEVLVMQMATAGGPDQSVPWVSLRIGKRKMSTTLYKIWPNLYFKQQACQREDTFLVAVLSSLFLEEQHAAILSLLNSYP